MKININTAQNPSLGKIAYLLVPVIWLVVLVTVSYFVGNTGYAKIKSQRQAVVSAKKTENIMVEKEAEIKNSKQYSLYVQPVSLALPDKNPTLILISVLRNMATSATIAMNNLRLSAGAEVSGAKQVNITFSAAGSYTNIMSLLKSSKTAAPLLTLQKVEFSILGDSMTGDFTFSSFYSAYPEKLPSVTEPISKLSAQNIETLKAVSNFTPPVFTKIPPAGPYERANPFL